VQDEGSELFTSAGARASADQHRWLKDADPREWQLQHSLLQLALHLQVGVAARSIRETRRHQEIVSNAVARGHFGCCELILAIHVSLILNGARLLTGGAQAREQIVPDE
jgi:hypothetical protein